MPTSTVASWSPTCATSPATPRRRGSDVWLPSCKSNSPPILIFRPSSCLRSMMALSSADWFLSRACLIGRKTLPGNYSPPTRRWGYTGSPSRPRVCRRQTSRGSCSRATSWSANQGGKTTRTTRIQPSARGLRRCAPRATASPAFIILPVCRQAVSHSPACCALWHLQCRMN